MITQSRLEALLTALEDQSPDEWHWVAPTAIDDRDTAGPYWCAVRYLTSRPPFRFLLEYNEDMLLTQYVFPELRVASVECWLALYQTLLHLNEDLMLVKFGLTAGGQITFLGEIPAAQFSLDTLENLLRLMVYYLERLYWEIDILVTCPQLAQHMVWREHSLVDRSMGGLVEVIKVERVAGAPDVRA